MNTSIRTDGSSDNAGVGFAVPSDTIVLIAERIINGESLELGFLGVSGDTPTDGTLVHSSRRWSLVPPPTTPVSRSAI